MYLTTALTIARGAAKRRRGIAWLKMIAQLQVESGANTNILMRQARHTHHTTAANSARDAAKNGHGIVILLKIALQPMENGANQNTLLKTEIAIHHIIALTIARDAAQTRHGTVIPNLIALLQTAFGVMLSWPAPRGKYTPLNGAPNNVQNAARIRYGIVMCVQTALLLKGIGARALIPLLTEI